MGLSDNAPRPAGKGCIRGAPLIEWLRWQSSRFGDQAAASALRHVPSPLKDCFDPEKPFLGIDPQGWYPAESFHALLDVVVTPLEPSVLEPLVDEAARMTMEGLMRRSMAPFAAALGSVERFARVSNALFRLVHDTGRVHFILRGPRHHESVVTEWLGHHRVMCRFISMCQVPLYEKMGCSEVRIRPLCVENGALSCGCVTTW
jgi:hypothetical protein